MDSNSFKAKTQIEKPDLHESQLVLHCKKGVRAMKGAHILQGMGYENVFTFPGGVAEWKQNNK